MKTYVLGILAILVVVGAAVYIARIPHTSDQQTVSQTSSTTQAASVDSFKIVKPKLYVYGKGLSSVKVFGLPTGTGMPDQQLLGDAVLTTTVNGNQTWVYEPTQYQKENTLMAGGGSESWWVEGYDQKGTKVDRLYLPDQHGAFELGSVL